MLDSLAQLQDRLPDADLGAELEGGGLGDAAVADVGAVGGAEVLDEPLLTGAGDAGVPGGDVVVVETDRRVVAAPDQQGRVLQGDGLALVAALDDHHLGGYAAAGPGVLLLLGPGLALRAGRAAGVLARDAGAEH